MRGGGQRCEGGVRNTVGNKGIGQGRGTLSEGEEGVGEGGERRRGQGWGRCWRGRCASTTVLRASARGWGGTMRKEGRDVTEAIRDVDKGDMGRHGRGGGTSPKVKRDVAEDEEGRRGRRFGTSPKMKRDVDEGESGHRGRRGGALLFIYFLYLVHT